MNVFDWMSKLQPHFVEKVLVFDFDFAVSDPVQCPTTGTRFQRELL